MVRLQTRLQRVPRAGAQSVCRRRGRASRTLTCSSVCLSSPFYGEDFYCEIPRSFRHLSFYIFDRDVFRRDSIIGRYRNGRFLLYHRLLRMACHSAVSGASLPRILFCDNRAGGRF